MNALYELAHQVMQTKDLFDPKTGVKMNWTMANAGVTNDAEYVLVSSIEPRLYLATRLIMDVSQGKAR